MLKDIIDTDAATKLRGFSFRIPIPVKSFKVGIHKSYHKGISPDFLEYKEYSKGDEPKHIDWRLYGRLDRAYVKKFEDETKLNWYILIDCSGSMDYGINETKKFTYALRLSATLAYLLLKQGDLVGIAHFSDEDSVVVPPRGSLQNLISALQRLKSLRPAGKTPFKEAIRRVLERAYPDSAFILVSDFLVDPESVNDTLKLLGAFVKETVGFHILHPEEINFDFSGSIEFEDMESGEKVVADASYIKSKYKEKLKEFIDRLSSIFHQNKAHYVFAPSDMPIEKVLIQIATG